MNTGPGARQLAVLTCDQHNLYLFAGRHWSTKNVWQYNLAEKYWRLLDIDGLDGEECAQNRFVQWFTCASTSWPDTPHILSYDLVGDDCFDMKFFDLKLSALPTYQPICFSISPQSVREACVLDEGYGSLITKSATHLYSINRSFDEDSAIEIGELILEPGSPTWKCTKFPKNKVDNLEDQTRLNSINSCSYRFYFLDDNKVGMLNLPEADCVEPETDDEPEVFPGGYNYGRDSQYLLAYFDLTSHTYSFTDIYPDDKHGYPPSCSSQTPIIHGKHIFLIGGFINNVYWIENAYTVLDEIWCLDSETCKWSKCPVKLDVPVFNCCATFTEDALYIFGGIIALPRKGLKPGLQLTNALQALALKDLLHVSQ